jgi:chorismate mutase
MNITEVRKEIDMIDDKIVTLIAERNLLMPTVARYKKENNLPLTNLEREQKILEEKRKLAEELGVDPNIIEKIFTLLFEEAKRVQEKTIS